MASRIALLEAKFRMGGKVESTMQVKLEQCFFTLGVIEQNVEEFTGSWDIQNPVPPQALEEGKVPPQTTVSVRIGSGFTISGSLINPIPDGGRQKAIDRGAMGEAFEANTGSAVRPKGLASNGTSTKAAKP